MLIKRNRIPVKQILFLGFFPSYLKILIYRIKGYKVGKNVSIGLGSIVVGRNVEIGDNTKIGILTCIKAHTILIEDHVDIGSFCFWDSMKIEIGQDTRIREQVFVGGITFHDSLLRIGKRVLILQNTFINPTKPIIIGDDVGIGGDSKIFTHASWQSALEGYPVIFNPVIIERNVWIAWDVFVMPGVVIGENSTIGTGSIVNVNIPPNSLGTGAPFKIAVSGEGKWPRRISDSRQKELIEKILIEFCEKLNVLGSEAEIDRNDNFKVITVNGKHKIIYLSSDSIESKFVEQNYKNLTIIYNYTVKKYIKSAMVIDLKKKIRQGKTPLGEELIKYFSHYGIRFARK